MNARHNVLPGQMSKFKRLLHPSAMGGIVFVGGGA